MSEPEVAGMIWNIKEKYYSNSIAEMPTLFDSRMDYWFND